MQSKIYLRKFVLLLSLIFCFQTANLKADLYQPFLQIPQTGGAPVIDGQLDDAAWGESTRISNFQVLTVRTYAEDQVTAFVTYDAPSRVLTDPTPARIASLVEKIINHIFLDGQLDECELTLKDIQEVKRSFTYILTGILHMRIDYPGFDFTDEGLYKEPAKTHKGKPSEGIKASQENSQSAQASQD